MPEMTPTPTVSRIAERLHWPLLALLLIVALVLGGSNRGASGDIVIQLAAVAVLAALCLRAPLRWPSAPLDRAIACAWLFALMLPLLHLLPLPPALWTALPGRAEVVNGLAVAGVVPGWMPLSLNPDGSRAAFMHLLIALAAYSATRALPVAGAGQRLLRVIFGVAVLSVVLGLAQFADGAQSPLRFHTLGPGVDATGFFGNRNHQALWLAACFPLIIVWTLGWLRAERHAATHKALGLTAGIGLGAVLLLGLALTHSRAGVVLGMLALMGSLTLLLQGKHGPRRGVRWIGISGVFGLVLAVQFGLYGLLQRFDADPLDDARFTIATVTSRAAHHYAPVGSGLGSFVPAYAGFERRETTYSAYVNHAHNDYLELWLEAGWPGLALLAACLALWFWMALRLWRGTDVPPHALLLARAAWLSLSLMLLHSLVDYPLRTPALIAFAGVLLGLIANGAALRIPSSAPR